MYVRREYPAQYRELNDDKVFAETKVTTIRRLLDSWSSQQFVLSRLSKNVESEIQGEKSFGGNTY